MCGVAHWCARKNPCRAKGLNCATESRRAFGTICIPRGVARRQSAAYNRPACSGDRSGFTSHQRAKEGSMDYRALRGSLLTFITRRSTSTPTTTRRERLCREARRTRSLSSPGRSRQSKDSGRSRSTTRNSSSIPIPLRGTRSARRTPVSCAMPTARSRSTRAPLHRGRARKAIGCRRPQARSPSASARIGTSRRSSMDPGSLRRSRC